MEYVNIQISDKSMRKIRKYMEDHNLDTRTKALNAIVEKYLEPTNILEYDTEIVIEGIEYTHLKDFPGLYVSTCGRLYDLVINNYKYCFKDDKGYFSFKHKVNGKLKSGFLHRLIAITFIPCPTGYRFVRHKDGNCGNNDILNLYWSNVNNVNYKK